MPILIGIIVCVFLIILRELEKSETRKILDKAKDMSFINKELESNQRKQQLNRRLSMTREEEIREASATTLLQINCDIHEAVVSAFQDGARWADSHPQSPWISVKDDLPCNHQNYINTSNKDGTFNVIAYIHGFVALSRMEKDDGIWHWTTDNPTHWIPIPELPKE